MRREPEVPKARVPVVECLDGPARITSKELAITHFCEKWHPPECLFYKTKSVGCLGKSAHRHTVRLINSRLKGPKNDDESAVAMLKKGDWHESVRELVINYGHDRSGATW